MRKALLVVAVLLAGCGQGDQADQVSGMESQTAGAQVSPSVPLPGGAAASVGSPEIHPSKPLQPPPPGTGRHFQALGTEPFWSFETSADKLVYFSPDQIEGLALKAEVVAEGKGYRYTAQMDGKPLVLVIQPGQCSDGMSDTAYAYTATYTLGNQTQHGCARAR